MRKQVYAGIDLHSNNLVVAMVDKQGKRIAHQKLPCELCEVIAERGDPFSRDPFFRPVWPDDMSPISFD